MPLHTARNLLLLSTTLLLGACVSFVTPADRCPADTQQLDNCPPPAAVVDTATGELYRQRTWVKPSKLDRDPIKVGKEAEIPVNAAQAKFLGPSHPNAVDSLAAKIWMIENAEHTVDVFYYIYQNDLSGKALMGAMCDAVERGVDVRFVADGIGSLMLSKSDMRALESCQLNAGFMRTADGKLTVNKARVQTVVFNSLTKLGTSPNRRAHDKLLVVDGHYRDKASLMLGGRNVSLVYYGLTEQGDRNPKTYADAELLIRNHPSSNDDEWPVARVAEIYYTLLYFYRGNKRISVPAGGDIYARYSGERKAFRDSLNKIKGMPRFQDRYQQMPEFFSTGFRDTDMRLAHEFGNLVNKRVVQDAVENMDVNPNSITRLLRENDGDNINMIRIVSPYLFLAKYKDKDGTVVVDEAKRMREWLAQDPGRRLEIVTNSIITSDNHGAQSVIDMDMVPRLLMDEEMRDAWLNDASATELNPEFLSSAEWTAMIGNPQVAVYETGTMASRYLGGDTDYGKLHAKFIITDAYGFVGTSNFDYRSRLYNNESGFFFRSEELLADLNREFDILIEHAYRWGSPEWLEMRRQLREQGGKKGKAVRKQRRQYKLLKNTGLIWLF